MLRPSSSVHCSAGSRCKRALLIGSLMVLAFSQLVTAKSFFSGLRTQLGNVAEKFTSGLLGSDSGASFSSTSSGGPIGYWQMAPPLGKDAKIGEVEDCNGFPVHKVEIGSESVYYGGLADGNLLSGKEKSSSDKEQYLSGKGFFISHRINPDQIYIGGWKRGLRDHYGVNIEFRHDGSIRFYPIYTKDTKPYPCRMNPCVAECLDQLHSRPGDRWEILKCALKYIPLADHTLTAMANTEVKDGTVVQRAQMEQPLQSFRNHSDWQNSLVLPFFVKSQLKLNARLYSEDQQFHPALRFWKVDPKTLVPSKKESCNPNKKECELEFKPDRLYYLEVSHMQPLGVLGSSNSGPFRVVFTKDTRTFKKIFDDIKFSARDPNNGNEYKCRLDEEGYFKVKHSNNKDYSEFATYDPTYCPYLNLSDSSLTFTFIGEEKSSEGGVAGFFSKSKPTGKINVGFLKIFCSKETTSGLGKWVPMGNFNVFLIETYHPLICELIKESGQKPTDIPCQEPAKPQYPSTSEPFRLQGPSQQPMGSDEFSRSQPQYQQQAQDNQYPSRPWGTAKMPWDEQKTESEYQQPKLASGFQDEDLINKNNAIAFRPDEGVLITQDTPTVATPKSLEGSNMIFHKIRLSEPGLIDQFRSYSLEFQMFRIDKPENPQFEIYLVDKDPKPAVRRVASNREQMVTIPNGSIMYVGIKDSSSGGPGKYALAVIDYDKSLRKWEAKDKRGKLGNSKTEYLAKLAGDNAGFSFNDPRQGVQEIGKLLNFPRLNQDHSVITYEFTSPRTMKNGPSGWQSESMLSVIKGDRSENTNVQIVNGAVEMNITTSNLDNLFNLLKTPAK